MMFELDPGSFPDKSIPVREECMTAAAEMIRRVAALFGERPPPLGVRPFRFLPGGPYADANDPAVYELHVAAPGGPVGELIFQGGHELAHIFLGPYRSSFAIEVIACAVSHELTIAMAPGYALGSGQDGQFSKIAWWKAQAPADVQAMTAGDQIQFFRQLRVRERAEGRLGEGRANELRGLQAVAAELFRASAPDWTAFHGTAHKSSVPVVPPNLRWLDLANEVMLSQCSPDELRGFASFGWVDG